jgi:GT2 family glycosyltransferase
LGQPGVDLSWIVVTHESARDLPVLLRSLVPALSELWERGLKTELILVDNASSDGSADLARRLVPWATRIVNPRNEGYGEAINRALEVSSGRWVAFGNADLFVPAGGLERLPGVLASQSEDVALVGPAIHGPDGNPALSAGRFPTLARLLGGLFRACHRRKYLDESRHLPGPVDWVTGACLFARAEHLKQVAGFDQRFFLYYEDVDLARRLASQGLRTVYDPRLSVVHVRPHHGRPPQPHIEQLVRESRMTYFAHHRPRWERTVLERLMGLETLVRRRSRISPAPPLLPRPHPGVVRVVPEGSWRLPALSEPRSAPLPEAPVPGLGLAVAEQGPGASPPESPAAAPPLSPVADASASDDSRAAAS